MPQAVPFIVAAVAVGTAVYGQVAAADARSKQEELLKQRLAQEGIVTEQEKKLKELQIAQVEQQLFGTYQGAKPPKR